VINKLAVNKENKSKILQIYKFSMMLRKTKSWGQNKISIEIYKKFKIEISKSTISGWINRENIPYANERTQFKTKPIPKKEILKKLYHKNKCSASQISKKI